MTEQIYMYENKINKIPRKVNKVGLGNYLLIYRSSYWKQKQTFFNFLKLLIFTGLLSRYLSWIFLNENRYSQKMQNCLFPKCLSATAFSNDPCSLLIVLKICKFFTLFPTDPSLILNHPFYSQKNEDIGWGDSQFFTGQAKFQTILANQTFEFVKIMCLFYSKSNCFES